jgi:hypothetical protein
MCSIKYSAMGAALLMASPVPALTASDTNEPFGTQIVQLQSLPQAVSTIKAPSLKEPEWLTQQKAAEAAAAAAKSRANGGGSSSNARIVTYDVTTRGVISASISEFKIQANATLNDGRGWARMGIAFQEVASGGAFTLVLSEASQVPSFSSGCDAEYSCRAGRYVIINQDRWLGATPSWNSAGGSLRDYRHMVVNHETGHWLGHGHASCPGAGQPALVMQQQSISLQGCTFNPWPTVSELWSTQLGIR